MKGHTFWDATEKAKRYVSYLVKKSHLDPTDLSDSSDSGVVKRCCTLPQLPSSRSNADVSAPRLRVSCVLAFIISRLRCVFCCCCSGRQRRDRCAVMTRGACPPLTRRGARLLAVEQVCAPACLALVLRSCFPRLARCPPFLLRLARLLRSRFAAGMAASRARRLEQVRDGHPQLPRVCHVSPAHSSASAGPATSVTATTAAPCATAATASWASAASRARPTGTSA